MQFTSSIIATSLFLVATSSNLLISASPIVEERTFDVNFNYINTFGGIFGKTCAVQASDYMTYSIKGSVVECLDFCDSVSGCKFVNTYIDANSAKAKGYTCALYKSNHGLSTLTNCGGQDQTGTGKLDKISQSAGWFKWN